VVSHWTLSSAFSGAAGAAGRTRSFTHPHSLKARSGSGENESRRIPVTKAGRCRGLRAARPLAPRPSRYYPSWSGVGPPVRTRNHQQIELFWIKRLRARSLTICARETLRRIERRGQRAFHSHSVMHAPPAGAASSEAGLASRGHLRPPHISQRYHWTRRRGCERDEGRVGMENRAFVGSRGGQTVARIVTLATRSKGKSGNPDVGCVGQLNSGCGAPRSAAEGPAHDARVAHAGGCAGGRGDE